MDADLHAVKPHVFAFHGRGSDWLDVESFGISPDGRQVAAVVEYGKSVLLDPGNSECEFLVADPFLARFNKSGTKVYLIGSRATHSYGLQSGQLFRYPQRQAPTERSYQERLVSGITFERGTWALVDPDTGAVVATFRAENINSSGRWAISHDKNKFAQLARSRNTDGEGIEVYDVRTGKLITYMPLDLDSWSQMRFSPDGSSLLIATDNSILVVDYRRRRIVREIRPDSASEKKTKTTTRSYGTTAGPMISAGDRRGAFRSWGGYSICSLDVTPDGKLAVGGDDGIVSLMTFDSGEQTFAFKLPGDDIERVQFSDNGQQLACRTDTQLYLVDLSGLEDVNPENGGLAGSTEAEEMDAASYGNGFAARQAAKLKVAQAISALAADDDPHVQQLAQELLKRLDDAAAAVQANVPAK